MSLYIIFNRSIDCTMDESLVNRILNMHKSLEPFTVVMPTPTSRKRKEDRCTLDDEDSKYNIESETDYINEYVQKDEEEYFKVISINTYNNIGLYFIYLSCSSYHFLQLKNNIFFNKNDHMDNVSEVTGDIAVHKEDTIRLYRMYNFAYRPNSNLPILSVRHKVVSMIASNSVVIIRGSTGCGKTTQVPQLILDAEFEKKQHCNIIGISFRDTFSEQLVECYLISILCNVI